MGSFMRENRGVVYVKPGLVEVQAIDFPKLALGNRKCEHGVILKVVATNICGSDQHMVRGRTTAPSGLILGHEITGEVIEVGKEVEFIKKGDLVSVPFNVACGKCHNCKERKTNICLSVNPSRPGGAYGYVDMGGWIGGQAEYVMVPYADFNLLAFPDREKAMAKIKDLALMTDIFPTGFHAAVSAGVQPGSSVYIAGAGPVGLACAASCHLLGAAVVIVGDKNEERLQQARSFQCETVNINESSLQDQLEKITQKREVDVAIDCVGFEAHGHGFQAGEEHPESVINILMQITKAGGAVALPGLYVTDDPGTSDPDAKEGILKLRIGLGWSKSHIIYMGQTPVLRYHRQLMDVIFSEKIQIARAVNATVISLDQAAEGYREFDKGAAKKFIIDPHGMIQ
jgi:glutathione-independent formaldehyde dehydrogenase